jgi:hypothetical protein
MCAACHLREDRDFPSTLKLRYTQGECGNCHGRQEKPDVLKVRGDGKTFYLAAVEWKNGAAVPGVELRLKVREALIPLGFKHRRPASAADVVLKLIVRLDRLTDRRFVFPPCRIYRARIDAVISKGTIVFRRMEESRPEFDADPDRAAAAAILDAWKALKPHLIEAMGRY